MSFSKECPLWDSNLLKIDVTLNEADYEAAMDKLASYTGMLAVQLGSEDEDYEDLTWLAEMIYHLSAALRSEFTLTDYEVDRILLLGSIEPKEIIVPVSTTLAGGFAHLARCESRQIYLMVRKIEESSKIDRRVSELLAAMSNYFYGIAMRFDSGQRFESRNY